MVDARYIAALVVGRPIRRPVLLIGRVGTKTGDLVGSLCGFVGGRRRIAVAGP
jgi:hypothetical protein